ncbi:hypothetical protein V8C26DRAFT_376282 [Trichoderma gracile]
MLAKGSATSSIASDCDATTETIPNFFMNLVSCLVPILSFFCLFLFPLFLLLPFITGYLVCLLYFPSLYILLIPHYGIHNM